MAANLTVQDQTAGKGQPDKPRRRLGDAIKNGYTLIEHLSSNVLSDRYLGMSPEGEDERDCFVEILKPEYQGDAAVERDFLNAEHAARIADHPGVVIPEPGHLQDGPAYLQYELSGGEPLEAYLRRRRGRVPPVEALRIAAALLEVLNAVHGKGLVVGDLRPNQLLLTRTGGIRIVGLGLHELAGQATGRRSTPSVPGASAFMSPELALSNSATVKSDLWAVGATLFELLSGVALRQGEDEEALVAEAAMQHPQKLLQVVPSAPPEITELVDRALSWDPSKRFASAAEFEAACRRLMHDPAIKNLLSLHSRNGLNKERRFGTPSLGSISPQSSSRVTAKTGNHASSAPSRRTPRGVSPSRRSPGRYSVTNLNEVIQTPVPAPPQKQPR